MIWMLRRARPPETIHAGPVVLERATEADGPAIALAVSESLSHLRPWMPWAGHQAADAGFQSSRLRESRHLWRRGSDFEFAIRLASEAGSAGATHLAGVTEAGSAGAAHPAGSAGAATPVVGVLGLHRRARPGVLEIGYWIHAAYEGRGYMTAAAGAATKVALSLRGIERVEIHTDEANTRSSAIPPRLGYRLERVDRRHPQAPAESGRLQIWVLP
jgi:RimJ/RimL family protein N-acetyltransferase